ELRGHDAVRAAEHLNTWFNIAAARAAVVQNAAYTRGTIEKGCFGARLPLVTLLSTFAGAFAAAAGFSELVKLMNEQRKASSYWSRDEWGRLVRGAGQTALAGSYASMGGYATYMYLIGRWHAARATS